MKQCLQCTEALLTSGNVKISKECSEKLFRATFVSQDFLM